MIGRLDGKVAIVTVVSRGISRAVAKLFSAKGTRVVCSTCFLHEGDHKLFDDSLTTTVSEDLKCNLESSWRNIYG
jgi:NAD(P)-dependent dehydrogenase (short-subunit alcohol dehydrogenase family)